MTAAPTSNDLRLKRIVAALVATIAGAAIVGWIGGWPALATWVPGRAVMVMNTAVCVVAIAVSLLAESLGRPRLAQVGGLAAAGLAAAVLLQFPLKISLGVDQWLWDHSVDNLGHSPGRMAVNTAAALVLAGLAVTLMAAGTTRRLKLTLLGMGVLALSALPLLNHVVAFSHSAATHPGMAVPTLVCLLLISITILRHAGQGVEAREIQFPPTMAAAVSLLVSLGFMAAQTNSELIESSHRIVRAHEVQAGIERVVARVARMETNARGYAISGDETMRTASLTHGKELLRLLTVLDGLVAGDPPQRERAQDLRRRAVQKIEHNDTILESRRLSGNVAEPARLVFAPSPAINNGMIGVGNSMKAEESRVLQQKEAEMEFLTGNTRLVQVLGSLVAFVLVGLTLAQTRRAAHARRQADDARLTAEAELRSSEERFRKAFEAAGIGMALVGLDGRWLRVNRTLCEIVGHAEPELLTKTFQDITHPDDLGGDLERLRDLIAGKERHYRRDKRYIHRQGHVVWVHLTVSVVLDPAGRPIHFVSQIEDITKRRQLQENLARARDQALEASRLKSEFLATISHEIRTPMNAVIGMAGLLADSRLTPEQADMAQTIQGGAEHLLAIIDDILDFSRIEAGRMRLDAGEFDFRRVVEETVGLLALRAGEKGLRIACEFELAPGTPLIGDRGRVRQVLTNLIGNAIKFTDAGEVAVHTRVVNEAPGFTRVRVTVRDTGIGIAPEAGRRLFQPFVQADGSFTRRFGGTGLGLAICRQLIGLMGGEIGFHSEPGKGSTFWFEVPFARGATTGSKPAAPGAAQPAATGRGRRLLLVEDNPVNQRVAMMMLLRLGYEVSAADNGERALTELARQPFDAVLMDCQMPVLDGYEATRRIRAGQPPGVNARIPIIALTAHARDEDRQMCFEAGMDAHVAKPIRAAELLQVLARCGLAAANGMERAGPDDRPEAPVANPDSRPDGPSAAT